MGFDIIIGNPPYGAEITEEQKKYFISIYYSAKTIRGKQVGSTDTYVLFIERGYELLNTGGVLYYIVPMSVISSNSVSAIHNLLEKNCKEIRVSSYADSPQPIFLNSDVNTSIFSFVKSSAPVEHILCTSVYHMSQDQNRKDILENLKFIDVKDCPKLIGRYPKISEPIEVNIIRKVFSIKTKAGDLIKEQGQPIYYRAAGGRYFKVVTNFSTNSSAEKVLYFDPTIANPIGALLSSSLFFWYYQVFSDNHNLKLYEIESFPVPLDKLTEDIKQKLENLYEDYLLDIERNARVIKTTGYKNIDTFKQYKIAKSKKYIDMIDDIICPLYGLSQEEIDFIKNYEIGFRLSEVDNDFEVQDQVADKNGL